MSPRNHSDSEAVPGGESGHFRSRLAQFGQTPMSGRELAASDPGEAADTLDPQCRDGV